MSIESHNPSQVAAQSLASHQTAFISLWGDMGARWGVPRSMTELHALLYIVDRQMNTDQIMSHLSISRGNASMTLRTLVDWGIVTRTHQREDRKDYYAAEQDVWKLFSTVARARKRRELEPLTAHLKSLSTAIDANESTELQQHRQRLESMIDFIDKFDGLSERFLSMGGMSINIMSTLLGSRRSKNS